MMNRIVAGLGWLTSLGIVVLACGGAVQQEAPTGTGSESGEREDGNRESAATDNGAVDRCSGEWTSRKPGATCTFTPEIQCFGNSGVSGIWVRCCGGRWTDVRSDGGDGRCP
jgi:hypothetical protein